MKKFIAFMVIALPLTAILSMAAGFWYVANARRVPAMMEEPARFPPTPQPATIGDVPLQIQPPAMPTELPVVSEDDNKRAKLLYAMQFNDIARRGNEILKVLEVKLSIPAVDSADWREGMRVYLDGLSEITKQYRALVPPTGMHDVHVFVLRFADTQETFINKVREAIETRDSSKVREATSYAKPMAWAMEDIGTMLSSVK